MKCIFYDYFYHDVVIRSLSYDFDDIENCYYIQFVLNIGNENVEEDSIQDLGKKVKCAFRNLYYSYVDLCHNIVGDYYISYSEVNDIDPILLEYKEKMKKYLSEEILCKLKCYSIYTNAGVIKIIAENDIEIFDT